MTTLTVQLDDSGESQAELQKRLGMLISALQSEGLAKRAVIEPVFPGEEKDALWKATFVVKITGRGEKEASLLSHMPGVQEAYLAPARG